MFEPADPEAYEICPYNNSHYILKYRMHVHLAKCRKVYHEKNNMAICLFNGNHRVPELELDYHHRNCRDRIKLEREVYKFEDEVQHMIPEANGITTDHPLSQAETWDNDTYSSYQPEEHCKKNLVIRQVKVESASVRRAFREEEKRRIRTLKGMGPSDMENPIDEMETKLRSIALSKTKTNVKETLPFSLENHIKSSQYAKQTVRNPNEMIPEDEIAEDIGNDENKSNINCDTYRPKQTSSFNDSDGRNDEGPFVMPRQRNKPGKGRGRGIIR